MCNLKTDNNTGKVIVHESENYINEYTKEAKPLIIADEANVDKIVLANEDNTTDKMQI